MLKIIGSPTIIQMLNKRATIVANSTKRGKWNEVLEADFQRVLVYFDEHGANSIEWSMLKNGHAHELPEMRCWLGIVLR